MSLIWGRCSARLKLETWRWATSLVMAIFRNQGNCLPLSHLHLAPLSTHHRLSHKRGCVMFCNHWQSREGCRTLLTL